MNIKHFQESLGYLFKAQLTPFVWGNAGIGKTTVVKEYAKNNNMKFFALYLGTQSDSGDILGLLDFVKDRDGNSISVKHMMPQYMKELIDYCNENPDSGAILFLDEFNRGRRDILQGMFSLALDKTFHTTKLPKNCHIVAAGNPNTDDYSGLTDIQDSALLARFVHVKLEPTFNEWVKYAKDSQIESTLLSFVQEQPQLLEDAKEEFDVPVKVDRRSFSRLDSLFKVETPQHLLTQLMYGIIGKERTVAYLEHLKNSDRPMSGEEFFNNKTSLDLLEKWSKGDVASSLLSTTVDNIRDYFVDIDEGKKDSLTKKQATLILNMLKIIPKDIGYKLILNLCLEFKNKEYKRLEGDKKFYEGVLDFLKEAKGLK